MKPRKSHTPHLRTAPGTWSQGPNKISQHAGQGARSSPQAIKLWAYVTQDLAKDKACRSAPSARHWTHAHPQPPTPLRSANQTAPLPTNRSVRLHWPLILSRHSTRAPPQPQYSQQQVRDNYDHRGQGHKPPTPLHTQRVNRYAACNKSLAGSTSRNLLRCLAMTTPARPALSNLHQCGGVPRELCAPARTIRLHEYKAGEDRRGLLSHATRQRVPGWVAVILG